MDLHRDEWEWDEWDDNWSWEYSPNKPDNGVQSSSSASNISITKPNEIMNANSLSAPTLAPILLDLSLSSTSETSESVIEIRSIKSAPEVPSVQFIAVLKKNRRARTPRY